MEKPRIAALSTYREYSVEEMQRCAAAFYENLRENASFDDVPRHGPDREIPHRPTTAHPRGVTQVPHGILRLFHDHAERDIAQHARQEPSARIALL
jgi:hypothetical protein